MRCNRFMAALFVLAIILVSSSAHGLRFDWTEQEKACAATIGVDLTVAALPTSPTFIRHLAWKAEAIALGRVTKVEHDLDGPYHTLATVDVLDVKKGDNIAPTIVICIQSGPAYFEEMHVMGRCELSGETLVASGEQLLFFLDRGYTVIPEDPTRFALSTNQYRMLEGYKFVVTATRVELAGPETWSQSISATNSEIDIALAAQSSNCR